MTRYFQEPLNESVRMAETLAALASIFVQASSKAAAMPNSGNVFRSGPLPRSWAAVYKICQRNAPAAEKSANSFGAVELVSGYGEQVYIFRLYVNGNMSRRLYCVGMEYYISFPADSAKLRNGLDGSDFVIGIHNGNQSRVAADGLFKVLPDVLCRRNKPQ